MKYIRRDIEKEVLDASKYFPVVTITGPRQSGKTTMVRNLFADLPYFSFENPDIRLFAKNDPRAFLSQNESGAILDEIHLAPEIISYLQQIVDENKTSTKYILTGSNNFSIIRNVSQSLAGRTAILKLLPFSLNEIQEINTFSTDQLILKGFYPEIYSHNYNPVKVYRSYYETYLERDLRQIVNIKDLSLFQKFIRICAGRIGNIFNASSIASEVGVSVTTINAWISVLEASFVVLLLQPYYENINKRLIKSPKLYFYDVGLASYLLGIEELNQVARDPLRGALFENLVLMDIIKLRYNQGLDHNLFFYRDSHQNEIDIVYKTGHYLITIEVKSSQTFLIDFLKGLKHFKNLMNDKIDKQFLAYDGEYEQKSDGIQIANFRHLTNYLF